MNKEHHVVIKEENTLKHSTFRVVSDVIVVGTRTVLLLYAAHIQYPPPLLPYYIPLVQY